MVTWTDGEYHEPNIYVKGIEAGGIEKKTVSLMPTTILSGLDTVGNNIKVTITRKPNVGNDKSTSSLVLHNLEVNMRRAAANTKSTSSQFSTIT